MSDRIAALRLFSRVARTGSFTTAGKETGLSQPSVSRIIANLEKELGAALFVRSTHAVRLTEGGENYLERIDPLLSSLDEAEQLLRGDGTLRGRLRIGAATSFAMREITPLLPGFLHQHPELNIDLVLTDSRQDLINVAIDVAIRFGALADSTMVARKLGTTPRLLVASPDYLARSDAIEEPADLNRQHIILGPASTGSAAWTFSKDGQKTSVRIDGRVTTNVNEVSTAAAVQGMGIVSTAWWGCRAEIESGKLVRLLPDWELGSIDVHAVLSAGSKTKPSARAFADYLVTSLQTQPAAPGP